MLMPKRTKFRRPHRLSYEGHAKGNSYISFGDYGLMASEGTYITAQQLEAARIALTRKMKRGGNVWCRIFPHMAKTKKPLEVRMGSGKGSPELWVAVVKKGTIMFEISGVPEDIAREAFRLAMHKLPIKCTIVKRNEADVNAPIVTKTLKKMAKLAADKNLTNNANINSQENLSKGVANE